VDNSDSEVLDVVLDADAVDREPPFVEKHLHSTRILSILSILI